MIREEMQNAVFLSHSQSAERSWHLLHSDLGAILVGNWYRSPSAPEEAIQSLRTEIDELRSTTIGIIVIRDINVHHSRWLYHSNGISQEGR